MPRRNQTNMRLGPPWPKNRSASMPLVESLSTLTGTANRCSSGVRRSTSCQPKAVERRTMPSTMTPGAATPMPMTWSVWSMSWAANCSMSSMAMVSSAPSASSDRYSIVPSRSVTAPWMNRDCDRSMLTMWSRWVSIPSSVPRLPLPGLWASPPSLISPSSSIEPTTSDTATRESPVRLPICARESSVAGNSSPKINARLFRRTSDGSALDVCPGARKATGGVEGFMAFLLSVLGNGWPLPWILHCIGSPL